VGDSMMPRHPAINHGNPIRAWGSVTVTVVAFVAVYEPRPAIVARQFDPAAGFFWMFQLETTAAALSGVPSLNCSPGRSVMVHTVLAALGVTDKASRGTTFSVTGSTVASEL